MSMRAASDVLNLLRIGALVLADLVRPTRPEFRLPRRTRRRGALTQALR
jgi:hypothetical protein